MDAHQQAGAVCDGAAVIVDVGAVGGADFAQGGAGAGHDIGDAKAIADLDQFAARDDGLAARRQFVQGEEDGSGIVVDGDGRRAEQVFEQRRGVGVALAAASGAEIVFQVAVAGEQSVLAERGAAEVGVEHDAGGVDDAAQRRLFPILEGFGYGSGDIGRGGFAGEDVCPCGFDGAARLREYEFARKASRERAQLIEDLVYRR